MTRATIWLALATAGVSGALALSGGPAAAQTAPGISAPAPIDETSAQSRRRPPRVRIYRSYPGPNARRECVAHYEQEFRVSGTVIVPRMNCWWTPG
jgi:hypothetical protein